MKYYRIISLVFFLTLFFLTSRAEEIVFEPEKGVGYFLDTETYTAILAKGSDTYEIIPSEIIYRGNSYRVTAIGEGAFKGSKITQLVLPQTIERIGPEAFSRCFMLGGDLVLPAALKEIGDEAFAFTGLKNLQWGKNIEKVGKGAFAYCQNIRLFLSGEEYLESWFKTDFADRFANPLAVSYDRIFYKGEFLKGEIIEDIEIPEKITNLKPWSLANLKCKRLYLSGSLTSIDSHALYELETDTLVLGKELSILPEGVFSRYNKNDITGCRSLIIEEGTDVIDLTDNSFSGSVTLNAGRNFTFSPFSRPFGQYGQSMLQEVTIGPNVTEIADNVFNGCRNLTVIRFAEEGNLLKIGDWAFNATSLSEYDDNSVIDLPEGLNSIGEKAFAGSGFSSIILPSSLIRIGNGAFADCRHIEKMTLPENSNLSTGLFAGCTALNMVTLSRNISEVPDSAFYGCSSLEEIILPEKVISVGNNAFAECSSLKNFVLQSREHLENIGYNSFAGCSGLIEIDLSNAINLNHLGEGSFSNCSSLQRADMANLQELKNLSDKMFAGCENLNTINLEGTPITHLGTKTFAGCLNITDLSFLSDVTLLSIGDNAFTGCEAIEEVDLRQFINLLTIGDGAFLNCKGIKTVFLNESLLQIGEKAFAGCPIENVNTTSKVPPVIGADVFITEGQTTGSPDKLLSLNVPENSLLDYLFASGYTVFDHINNYELIDGRLIGYRVAVEAAMTEIPAEENPDVSYPDDENPEHPERENAFIVVDIDAASQSAVVVNDAIYKSLKTLAIPSVVENGFSITALGEGAFAGAGNLERIDLPYTIEEIGSFAFSDCGKLQEIRLYAGEPPTAGENILDPSFVETGSIYVLPGMERYYESMDSWNGYKFLPMPVINADSFILIVNDRLFEGVPVDVHVGETVTVNAMINPLETTRPGISHILVEGTGITYINSLNGLISFIPNKPGQLDFLFSSLASSRVNAHCLINVLPRKVELMTLSESVAELYVNETSLILEPQFIPSMANTPVISWSSSNPVVATVSDGIVTAKNIGETVITATMVNNGEVLLKADCHITVRPHTLTYRWLQNTSDGEDRPETVIQYYNTGDQINPIAPPPTTGYQFTGWDGLPENRIMPPSDLTVEGLFSKSYYFLTYIVDSGNGEEIVSVNALRYDEEIEEASAPSEENAEFFGWYGLPQSMLMPAEEVIVYGFLVKDEPENASVMAPREEELDSEFIIYNLAGRIVAREKCPIDQERWNGLKGSESLTDKLTPGIYILKRGKESRKLIIGSSR